MYKITISHASMQHTMVFKSTYQTYLVFEAKNQFWVENIQWMTLYWAKQWQNELLINLDSKMSVLRNLISLLFYCCFFVLHQSTLQCTILLQEHKHYQKIVLYIALAINLQALKQQYFTTICTSRYSSREITSRQSPLLLIWNNN